MKEYYSPAEAAQITGASKPALRTYTNTYARWFSTDATPEKGGSRQFTEADLKLVAFIRLWTVSQNKSHAETAAALVAGELDLFDWQPPEAAEEPLEQPEAAGSALVPVERLQAAQVLITDAKQRETDATARLEQAQERISELERELGQASGELAGFKAAQHKAPAWWRALFGGRSAD